jgi:hypothetical protein
MMAHNSLASASDMHPAISLIRSGWEMRGLIVRTTEGALPVAGL